MTCDLCSQREATVHLTEIIQDQSRDLHLCESCAREKGSAAVEHFSIAGLGGSEPLLGSGLADLLAGLTDIGTARETKSKTRPACPQCGMTYDDFRKSGRLGCGTCYETFHRLLAPLLRRIHSATHHVGKSPRRKGARSIRGRESLAQLKEQLHQAIAAEVFEKAARLRDRIRTLESKLKRARPRAG